MIKTKTKKQKQKMCMVLRGKENNKEAQLSIDPRRAQTNDSTSPDGPGLG